MANKFLMILLVLFTNTVQAETLEEIITYLSSDKLEGRKPGQMGNELAQTYLEKKFKNYGLLNLGDSNLQEFTIFTEMKKIGNNSLVIDKTKIEFEPISYSLSGTTKKRKLAFVGFGITIPKNDPKLKYDDYKGIDVKDKVVVVLTGDPGIGNPKSKFRNPDYQNYSSLFFKLKNAIEHGAKGIILVNDPMTLNSTNSNDRIIFNNSEGGGSRFSIIAGKSSYSDIKKYFKSKTLLEIQREISKKQIPQSLYLDGEATLSVNLKKVTGRVSNIVGFKRGSDSVLQNQVIVLGAHMDHLGFGGESSMDPHGIGKIHNGADDNASGTAIILQLAKYFQNITTKRSIAFVLFNAEEMGLLGSTHFLEYWNGRYIEKYGKMVAMLNFDMVGRYQSEVSVMGTGSFNEKSLIRPRGNSKFNYVLKKQAVGSSDHAVFLNNKIPALFLTTGAHDDYHRPSDTYEKINYPALKDILKYGIALTNDLSNTKSVSFNSNYNSGEQGGRNRGYGAHLGCVPKFGQSEDITGVVCVKASSASPAEAAGILPEDILVQIGDVTISTIYDLAFALKYYRAGDKVEIAWKRKETLFKQIITLAKSTRH